jgi:hypothetical protein
MRSSSEHMPLTITYYVLCREWVDWPIQINSRENGHKITKNITIKKKIITLITLVII